MVHSKSGKVFTELVLEIFRFNGRLLAAGDRLTKPLGLTGSRWQVLGAIEARALSVAQVARKMGLTRQNVQRLADALANEGIVRYAPNPEHQRAKLVCPTAKGRGILRVLSRRQALWANRVSSGAGAVDLQAALSVVKKLRSRLEEAGGA